MMKRESKQKQPIQQVDMDPFSTSILEELLETPNEWKRVQDIVKLTLRAMSDIIYLYGGSIKDMKNLLTTRASKTQLTTGLSLKANISDLSRAVTDLSSGLDSKVSFKDMQNILREYVNRNDMQQVLASRNSIQQTRITKKINNEQKNMDISVLQARMDEFQREICKKVGSCVTIAQFQQIITILDKKANISQVNEALENKVSKTFLSTSLQKKVNKTDLQALLVKKADASDLQFIINNLEGKANISTLQKLTNIIQNKADKSDVSLLNSQRQSKMYYEQLDKHNKNAMDKIIKQTKSELQQIRKQLASSNLTVQSFKIGLEQVNKLVLNNFNITKQSIQREIQKINNSKLIEDKAQQSYQSQSVYRQLTNQIAIRKKCQAKIYQQIDDVRRRTEEVAGTCLQKRQYIDFKSQIMGIIQEKIEAQAVQTALNKWQTQINQKLALDKQQIFTLLKNVQKNLSDAISLNNNDIVNINSILAKKQQKFESNILEELAKKTRKQVQQCRKIVDTLYAQLQGKISIPEYQNDLLQIKKKFDSINRQLVNKANIKDVCVLADSKPNIDDVNKALKQLNAALEDKISDGDLRNVLKDQSSINETLCSQNIVGRWLWQSGDIKPGGLIPWQIECANTVPDHFFWQKDKTSILILDAGIYELTACLFSKNGYPNILVNGQVVNQKLQESSSSTILMKKTSKKKKDKQVGSNRVHEFVMIPSRTRISVNSSIQGIQGFLNIKRL